jgi:predicted nucleic acid-binding protein
MSAIDDVLFADTYALVEIIRGNTNYRQHLSSTLFTTKFNLIELYYFLLKDYGKKDADRCLKTYSSFLIPISSSTIQSGMLFKLENRKENLSYVDCIGYALSIELGIKFLTGDIKFKNRKNVEFVK